MDFWTYLMLAAALWLLWGPQWLDERSKRRSEARKAVRDAFYKELMEAADERDHWVAYGRGKPYQYYDMEKILAEQFDFHLTLPEERRKIWV